MESLYNILQTLKSDLETDLPALLVAAGLVDFNRYVLGPSKNPEETALCLYHDEGQFDDENNDLNLFIQLQLYEKDYEDSLKYIDVVKEYMKVYDPANLGFTILKKLIDDSFPLDENQTTFVFFEVKYNEQLDSCD